MNRAGAEERVASIGGAGHHSNGSNESGDIEETVKEALVIEGEISAEVDDIDSFANGGIQLLLIQSVENLGNQGEVVEVKPGFANNYLLPQGLATLASDHHKRMVEKHKAQLLEIEKSRLASLRGLADALNARGIPTARGGRWQVSTVKNVLRRDRTACRSVSASR